MILKVRSFEIGPTSVIWSLTQDPQSLIASNLSYPIRAVDDAIRIRICDNVIIVRMIAGQTEIDAWIFLPLSRRHDNLWAMRAPDKLSVYLLELLAPIGPVTARRMFGGVGLFHGGMMFGLIARDELYLKVGDGNRPAYEAAGEAPFSYDTKLGTNTIQSYWRCPPELLDDAEMLQAWARQSIDVAANASRVKPKARRKLTASVSF